MKQKKFVFLSAVSGNILEYYDFTVYAVFANLIAQTFFDSHDFRINLLSSLLVFAVGFLTRPIGGIFFGYIGDIYGRRISLIISMLGMTIPTFAIGLIPSYDHIGIAAPVILILCRLLQGLCISGEGAGAAIFVLEHYNNLRPGLVTGLVHGSNILGSLIATIAGILLQKFMPDNPDSWRYAFIIGGVFGIAGFYLRLRVAETPIFKELAEKKHKSKIPLINVIKTSYSSVFITFVTGAVTSSIVYLVKSYVNVFYSSIMKYDNSVSLWYSYYCLLILMISMPIAGYLADIVGKVKMIKYSVFIAMIVIFPILEFMSKDSFTLNVLALTALGGISGFISGTAYIFVISLFKPSERFTGVAFSYNLGIAIFGGTSPAIAYKLIDLTSNNSSPAIYIILMSLIFLISVQLMDKKIQKIIEVKSV